MHLKHNQTISGSKPHKYHKDDGDAKSVYHRKGADTLKPQYQRGIGSYTCRTMSCVDGHKIQVIGWDDISWERPAEERI